MTRRMDSKGVIAIIAAFALPALLVLVGGAVDLTRTYIVKQRAQAGVDAAALVIGAEGSADEPTKGEADAEKIFWNNFNPSGSTQGTGVLNSTMLTLVVGSYNATTKQVPVTATVSVPLLFSMLQKSGTITVSSTAYATFSQQTGSGRGWIALLCYKTSVANSSQTCANGYAPSYGSLQVVPTSSSPVIVDGPVCFAEQNGKLGTDCLSSYQVINQSMMTISTDAILTAQNTDTNGNKCPYCDSVQFDGGFTVNSGTTTITGMTVDNHGGTSVSNSALTVTSNATYHSSGNVTFNNSTYNGLSDEVTTTDNQTTLTNSSLSLDSNGQYCDNGINASNSTISVSGGGSLGCSTNSHSSAWTIGNNSKLALSSSASLYVRGGNALTINASSFDLNNSTAQIGVNGGVSLDVYNNSIVTIENNSNLYVGNYLDIQGQSSLTSSSSTISVSGLKLNSPGTLTLGSSTNFTDTGNSGSNISSTLNVTGGSSATVAGYAPISGATITVSDENSVLTFTGQTDISNTTINVSNGASLTFKNAPSAHNVTINCSGGGSVTIQNISGYNSSSISGTVNGAGSTITFNASSPKGILVTNITPQNGGVVTVTP